MGPGNIIWRLWSTGAGVKRCIIYRNDQNKNVSSDGKRALAPSSTFTVEMPKEVSNM